MLDGNTYNNMGLMSPAAASPRQLDRTLSSNPMHPLSRSPASAPIPIGRSPSSRPMNLPHSTSGMHHATLSPPSREQFMPRSPPRGMPGYPGSPPTGGHPSSVPFHASNMGGPMPKGLATPRNFRSELPSEGRQRRESSSAFNRGMVAGYESEVFDDSSDEPDLDFPDQRLPNPFSPYPNPPTSLRTQRKSVSFGLEPDYIPAFHRNSPPRARDNNPRPFNDPFNQSPFGNFDQDRGRSRSRDDLRRPRANSTSYVPSYIPMQSPYGAPPTGPPPYRPSAGIRPSSSSGVTGSRYQIYKPLSPPSAPPMTPMMAYTSPTPGHLHRSESTQSHHPPGHRRRYSDTQSLQMLSSPRMPLVHQHSVGPVYPQRRHRSRSSSHSRSSGSKDKAKVYQVLSSPGYYPVTISNAPTMNSGYYYTYHHKSKGAKHRSYSTTGALEAKPLRRASTTTGNVLVRRESERERKDRKDRERYEKDKEKERSKRKEKEIMKRWKEDMQRRGSHKAMPMMYGGYAVGVPMAPATELSAKPKKHVRFRRMSF